MSILDVLPGVNAAAVVQTLQQTANDTHNVSSTVNQTDGDSWLNAYLRWAENAHRSLGNVFPPDVVDELVHTSNYWALRAATSDTPRLLVAVRDDLERQQRYLTKLADEFEAERKRWADAPAYVIVPDTNIFLQEGRPFEEIDWHAVIDRQIDVRLVIPIIVIHELDRLKRTGNNTTRKLARQALRWMSDNLPADLTKQSEPLKAGRPTTTVEVVVQDGPSKPDDADGLIIRFTRQLAVFSALRPYLATYDLSMQLRAKAQGVNAIQLPDE